jgi:hypothetical protein
MKPLPAQHIIELNCEDSKLPSLPHASTYSKANRRVPTQSALRVYPWLLFLSTAIAALFCVMYITKPVIMASQNLPLAPPLVTPPATIRVNSGDPKTAVGLMPSKDRLPGETTAGASRAATEKQDAPPQASSPFEQTNLRIQHILTAEAPGGHRAKIDIDVPVLYQSRNLRWTTTEVANARDLLIRLANYQERTRILRAEGAELLESWNQLVEKSIPATDLRADSPTLPTNQQDAADAPRPALLDTSESIKLQPAGK